MSTKLTPEEQLMLRRIPKPPRIGNVLTNELLILECLGPRERRTGLELWEWAEARRKGWAKYFPCVSRDDLFRSLDRAMNNALNANSRPVLHIEAHGSIEGLAWTAAASNLVRWDELVPPLQRLNVATRCNLLVVISACFGIAGINVMAMGPRAPVLGVVGPCSTATPHQLREGYKEFYRRLIAGKLLLHEFADAASAEVGAVDFAVQPFTILAWETLAEQIVLKTRPWRKGPAGVTDATHRHARRIVGLMERLWSEMFMMDLYPENAERFGFDVRTAVLELTT